MRRDKITSLIGAGIFTLGIACPSLAVARRENRFPILAWYGPDRAVTSPEVYRKMVEAGFSLNLSFYDDPAFNRKALDWAAAAGLRLILSDSRINAVRDEAGRPLSELDAVIADYARQSAFWGYYIQDEPNAARFERLGAIAAYLKTKDPRHPSYINLFPTYATGEQLGTPTYREHCEAYLKTVRPEFVSYDHYPILPDKLREDYYLNLEIIRNLAVKNGLPFWAFTLSVPHLIYPKPTLGHLRFQVWSDLAYGAKAVQYFTYGSPQSQDFRTALIDQTGGTTDLWELARQVNGEIRRVEPLLLAWRSLAVYHGEPVPNGCLPFPAEGLVTGIEGGPFLAGILASDGDEYVVIVNRDYENSRAAVAHFSRDVIGVEEIAKDPTGRPFRARWAAASTDRVCALLIEPGDARILKIRPESVVVLEAR